MLVRALPGASRTNLLEVIGDARLRAANLRGQAVGTSAGQQRRAYLFWVEESVRQLRSQIAAEDINRLILTRGYELLLTGISGAGSTVDDDVLQRLLNLEIDQRVDAFDDAVSALDTVIKRWDRFARFVIPDTSVFITHPEKLRQLDFAAELEVPSTPVHLVIPIAVIDELDRLKQSTNKHVRWRAGHSLGVLDEVLRDSPDPGRLVLQP